MNDQLLLLVCDGLLWTLSGSRVVLRVLAANRKASSVTDASVATDLSETLDVHSDFTAKVTFYHVILSDDFAELLDFFVGQVSAPCVCIDACLLDEHCCGCAADAINAGQTDLNALISG